MEIVANNLTHIDIKQSGIENVDYKIIHAIADLCDTPLDDESTMEGSLQSEGVIIGDIEKIQEKFPKLSISHQKDLVKFKDPEVARVFDEKGWSVDGVYDTTKVISTWNTGEAPSLFRDNKNIEYFDELQYVNLQENDNHKFSISSSMFNGCSNLKSVTLPNVEIWTIGTSSFLNCTSLQHIDFPERVGIIGDQSFDSCTSLTINKIPLPFRVNALNQHAFSYCYLLNVDSLPEGLVEIRNRAFNCCYALSISHLPSTLKILGPYAFLYCRELRLSSLPDVLERLDNYAFKECAKITISKLSPAITYIGEGVFNNCTSITEFTWNNVMDIPNNTFQGCQNLKKITMTSTTPPTLGTNAIPKNQGLEIIVPAGCANAYKSAWPDYAEYIVEE